MLPTSAGVEPATSWSPVGRRIQLSHRGRHQFFSTKGPDDLDLCPQDHLLVRTNISTKFEGPNYKHCRIISFFWLKGHLLFRSILPVSLIVLGLIIANGFLLYVKQVTPTPHSGWGLFLPQGHNLNTLQRTSRQCYIPNIKGLGLALSDKKIFKVSFLYKSMQNMSALGRGHLRPQGYNLKNFAEVL